MALCEGFSHLVLPVADLDRSEKFYQSVFGLELVGRDLVSEGETNSLLKADSRQMVLLIKTPPDQVKIEREGANSTHHAWLVKTADEYKAVSKHLEELGFDMSDYRAAFRAAGQYSVDLVDPDGHRWQIQAQGPEATDVRVERAGIINCGPADQYKLNDIRLFKDQKFFIVRLEEGLLALSQWCTHQNGLMKWRDNFYDFYCPKHGATFNREGDGTGSVLKLPPMRLHPLQINDKGEVEVDTDRVILRRNFDAAQVVPMVCGAKLQVDKLKFVKEVV
jgi:catechol 2,3-dioxygenase-like lactoylglutathione lyase family enzyme